MATIDPAAGDAARAFAVANVDRFVDELRELLRIPSISTEPDRAPDIERAAEWLAERLRATGCANVAVMPTAGYPVDAKRFFAEINPAMAKLGLTDDQVWRKK